MSSCFLLSSSFCFHPNEICSFFATAHSAPDPLLELSAHACFSSSQLQVTKWPYENTRIKISHELLFICVLCSWSKMPGQILLFLCFPFMVESDELQLCSPEMVAVWWRVWKLCSDPCRETQVGKIMVTDQQNWVLFFPLLGLLVGSWVSQVIVHLHN